jgi:hypothetical protein
MSTRGGTVSLLSYRPSFMHPWKWGYGGVRTEAEAWTIPAVIGWSPTPTCISPPSYLQPHNLSRTLNQLINAREAAKESLGRACHYSDSLLLARYVFAQVYRMEKEKRLHLRRTIIYLPIR